jgi:hypothetical protein
MAVEGPTVADVGAVMSRLAEAYTVGGAADAAGIDGGRDLQLMTADYLAELAARHSFVNLAITSQVPPESAFAAVAYRFVAASRDYLARASRAVLGFVATHPTKIIVAGAIAGAIGVTYSWLTMAERIELARLEELSELLRVTFNGLPAEERSAAFARLAGGMAPRVEASNWLYLAMAAGIGLALYYAWQRRTD